MSHPTSHRVKQCVFTPQNKESFDKEWSQFLSDCNLSDNSEIRASVTLEVLDISPEVSLIPIPPCPVPTKSLNQAVQDSDSDDGIAGVLHEIIIDEQIRAYLYIRLTHLFERLLA